MKITGIVTPRGYVIYGEPEHGVIRCLYRAMSDGLRASVPVSSLEGWCDQTGEELAICLKGDYTGHVLSDDVNTEFPRVI